MRDRRLFIVGGQQLAAWKHEEVHFRAERDIAQVGLGPAIFHDGIRRHREGDLLSFLRAKLTAVMHEVGTDELASHALGIGEFREGGIGPMKRPTENQKEAEKTHV